MNESGAPQLVGMKCTLCEKSIGSVIDGYFCSACGCPVHNRCVEKSDLRRNGVCRRCGSAVEIAQAREEQERQESATLERDVRSYHAMRHVMFGIVWIVGGIGVSAFCLALSGGRYLVTTGAVIVGIGQIVYGLSQLSRKGPDS